MKRSIKKQLVFFFVFILSTFPFYISFVIAENDKLMGGQTVIGRPSQITGNAVYNPAEAVRLASLCIYANGSLNLNNVECVCAFTNYCPNYTLSDTTSYVKPIVSNVSKGADLTDPGDATQRCIDKHEKNNDFVEFMDSDIIALVEKITAMMYLIYTTMTAVHSVISAVSAFFSLEGGCCLGQPWTTAGCTTVDSVKNVWDGIYHNPAVSLFGCMISCGWCSGQAGKESDRLEGSSSSTAVGAQGCWGLFGSIPIFNSLPEVMGFARLSPFENIYTALACLCPTAILFNLRKLKTIYQTYDCCIEQACQYGISTEVCDKMLDVSSCMYWKGSIYKMLVKVLMGILASYVAKYIAKLVAKNLIPNCILSLIDLAEIPGTIAGVQEGIKWVSVSFSEPECSDLGFDTALLAASASQTSPQQITLYDADKDGKYDTIDTYSPASLDSGEVIAHSASLTTAESLAVNNLAVLRDRGYVTQSFNLPNAKKGDVLVQGGEMYVIEGRDATYEGVGIRYITDNGPVIVSQEQLGTESTLLTLEGDAPGAAKSMYRGATAGIIISNARGVENVYGSIEEAEAAIDVGESIIVSSDNGRLSEVSKYTDNNGEIVVEYKDVPITVEYSRQDIQIGETKVENARITTATSDGTTTDKYATYSGKLYKFNDRSNEWEETDDAKPVELEGVTPQETLVWSKRDQAQQKTQENAFKLTWMLLDATLGSYAYGKIDEMCMKEWESSEPEQD